MNSLKSLFFLGVLAAAACGVYVSLNCRPDATVPSGGFQNDADPPAKAAGAPPAAPKVELPAGPGSSTPLGTVFAGPGRESPAGAMPGVPFPPSAAEAKRYPGESPPSPTAAAGTSLFPPPVAMAPGSVAVAGTPAPTTPGEAATAPPSSPGGMSVPPPPGDPSVARRNNLDMPSDTMARYNAPPPSHPAPADAAGLRDGVSNKLGALMKAVEAKMDAGQLAEAHRLLTASVYADAAIPPEQARQIMRLLDQMAATVIYSRQHLLEPAYRVQPGDTLQRIAERYNIPPQLLAKINGIRDPQNLPAGRELKVIRGPFSALVDLSKPELTLMVQGRYAGRFPIDVDTDPAALARLPGTYMVRNKSIPSAGVPTAPAGQLRIDLGNQVSIEARSGGPAEGRRRGAGAMHMASRDLEDVFDILSVGSRVVIQR